MKKYIILAKIELNIGDEYYRHVSNVFVSVVSAETEAAALAQCTIEYNDEFNGGKVQDISAQEV